LIESGKLTVYEGWTEPFEAIPKDDFFGVWIRYPSYPDDRQEDIRRAYQAGFRTFIDCDLSQPRNPYFEARKFEPKWRDLKIRSQQLVAIALEINGQNGAKSDKGQQDLRGMPEDMSKFYEPWPDYEWLAAPAKRAAKVNKATVLEFTEKYFDRAHRPTMDGLDADWKEKHGSSPRELLRNAYRKVAEKRGIALKRGPRCNSAK
jgi:hypothetical protein